MSEAGAGAGDAPRRLHPRWPLAVIGLLVLLRLLHVVSALRSPLTYEPGPDEVYHLEFARALIEGRATDAAYGFMDPLYPYALAGLFSLVGQNLFVLFLCQLALDAFTAYGLIRLGRILGDERVGVGGALLYALSQTATMSVATLLKSTSVAAFVVWWCVLAWRATDQPQRSRWLVLGAFTGLGVALRGNFLLLALLAVVALPWLARSHDASARTPSLAVAGWLLLGLAPVLAGLAWRNHGVSGGWSPLPTNGGVVLHQLYNDQNPRAVQFSPAWVSVPNPVENWRGYRAEAERRAGHALEPAAVDRYWRGVALDHIVAHPGRFLANVARKLGEFSAFTEAPNNRSLADEREYSRVIRVLPPMFGLLFALGLPGLVVLLRRDRRALVIALPLVVIAATFVVFFAEERYRFHGVPLFCLLAASFAVTLARWLREGDRARVATGAAASGALLAVSLLVTSAAPATPVNWYRIAKGHVRAGEIERARAALEKLRAQEPASAHSLELVGYFAMHDSRAADAVAAYRAALELRGDRATLQYNLALALLADGQVAEAIDAATRARALSASADTDLLLGDALARGGDVAGARASYRRVLDAPAPSTTPAQRARATSALAALDAVPPSP